MPYIINRVKSGFKVFSESGRPLSNKPLTLKKAKAQRTAVNLSELGIQRKK